MRIETPQPCRPAPHPASLRPSYSSRQGSLHIMASVSGPPCRLRERGLNKKLFDDRPLFLLTPQPLRRPLASIVFTSQKPKSPSHPADKRQRSASPWPSSRAESSTVEGERPRAKNSLNHVAGVGRSQPGCRPCKPPSLRNRSPTSKPQPLRQSQSTPALGSYR